MIRWKPIVWPPWWALFVAILIFAGVQVPLFQVEWLIDAPFFSFREEQTQRAFVIILTLYAILHGVFRAWVFHPGVRPEYRRWLNGTPWTSRKPLPLGPVQLVWQ